MDRRHKLKSICTTCLGGTIHVERLSVVGKINLRKENNGSDKLPLLWRKYE